MTRYRLDDLLGYQSEKLVQSLLKASISLDIEAWGNRSDFGRDAYTPHALNYPDKKRRSNGPFLFQVKFVENANAAGAKPAHALLTSADKEIAAIKARKTQAQWRPLAHFTFITNALIQAALRDKLRSKFEAVLDNSEVHIWGGDDVCALLDSHTQVTRAFPQLLSIQDLDALIAGALSKESRERSSTAVQIARELVQVFAPTSAYARAWKVAQRYHFVVLEGPPEVGKSAIAWMLGLTQVGVGWEAIVCRTPDTFFEMIERGRPQIFIADDAFGRTEYDPTRTTRWEADLDHILHRIDREHWLIWTSREHILERACARMDAEGKARSFPDPAAVIVDTDTLSVEERALILFRHARASGLETETKHIVKQYASQIVFDKEFTPERMRRFTSESLPQLVRKMKSEKLKNAEISAAITEALRNPTKQMRLAFRKLPAAYKWFLVALLQISESDNGWRWKGNVPVLRDLYDSYCPEAVYEPFDTVLSHLTEAFVKMRTSAMPIRTNYVDWIHPSYRDLIIDELVDSSELRNTFLRRASLDGIKVAVSDTGGREGQRRLPFMRSAESWDILRQRCLALVEPSSSAELLGILSEAAAENDTVHLKPKWQRLLKDVCDAVSREWEAAQYTFRASELRACVEARALAALGTKMPNIRPSWDHLVNLFEDGLRHAKNLGVIFDFDLFDTMVSYADVVKEVAPDFLVEVGYPENYESQIADVLEQATFELEIDPKYENSQSYRELSERLHTVAGIVDELPTNSEGIRSTALSLATRLERRSTHLEEKAAELEPQERDDDGDYDDRAASTGSETFDIQGLFSEL